MATTSDYAQLTQIGPGTPMGKAYAGHVRLRRRRDRCRRTAAGWRCWAKKLIAFRDSNGRVGILDHRCPHRGASLFLGRNEECGLRCVYHGWKFDVSMAIASTCRM